MNVVCEQQEHLAFITLNRIDKHNAFDDTLLLELRANIEECNHNPEIRVIILRANGRHFSAGADLVWMQRMINANEAENLADAMVLADTLACLHESPKITIAMVHGSTFGGGVGLIAACDIAIATSTASFCFSEVTLGLIPAVISPYIIKAIGERVTRQLFLTAERFTAEKALALQLVHHVVPDEDMVSFTMEYVKKLTAFSPGATYAAKQLINDVSGRVIDASLKELTANYIAKQRVSPEGQQGLRAFLSKDRHVS